MLKLTDVPANSGKVSDIQVKSDGDHKTATVTFEKDTAMKTALLLNNTMLGNSTISVTSPAGARGDEPSSQDTHAADADEITQEMKPRARILAEYLASGYVIGDAALERAIDLDAKHGVSNRFLSTLQRLDQKYHATNRAKATDESYGISARGLGLLSGLGSYFENVTNTPTGKKIARFYTESTREVQDIHSEAMRLAELKKEAAGGSAYKAAGLERVFGKADDGSATAAGSESPAPTKS
jgi:hypothetical protein